jgi:hypothetical protein
MVTLENKVNAENMTRAIKIAALALNNLDINEIPIAPIDAHSR